jgi:ketosteroid isomerase-like protein
MGVTAVQPFTPSLFDRPVFLRLLWTRMPDSASDGLSPACHRLSRGLCAAVAAISFAAAVHPAFAGLPKPKEDNPHQIDRLEDAWRSAVMTANTKSMDALLDKEYVAITPSGTLQSREDALENMRADHFTTLDVTDRKVRFYGSTAIVTSQVNIDATTPDGPVTGHYWYTRVYARTPQGQWKIVSFEASRVRESGPHKRNEFH